MKAIITTQLLGLSRLNTYSGELQSEYILHEDSIKDDFENGEIEFDSDYYCSNFENNKYSNGLIKLLDKNLSSDLLNMFKPFGVSKVVCKEIHEPKEYNFRTTNFDFEITCNKRVLKRSILNFILENKTEFNSFLRENYSSYSGFISFIDNNISDFIETFKNDFDDREIGVFFGFLVHLDNQNDEIINDAVLYMLENCEMYFTDYVDYTNLENTIESIKSGNLDNDECISDDMFEKLCEKYMFGGEIKKVIQEYYSKFSIEQMNEFLQEMFNSESDFSNGIESVYSEINSQTLKLF